MVKELAEALEGWKVTAELAWEAERSVESAVVAALAGGPGPSADLIERAQRLRVEATLAFERLSQLSA